MVPKKVYPSTFVLGEGGSGWVGGLSLRVGPLAARPPSPKGTPKVTVFCTPVFVRILREIFFWVSFGGSGWVGGLDLRVGPSAPRPPPPPPLRFFTTNALLYDQKRTR